MSEKSKAGNSLGDITIKFDEKGLVPAIIQHVDTKEVLTLAYMNEQSLQRSIATGETWFYSRSRQELWHKGETSGNTQQIRSMYYDCDNDAILIEVKPRGPACHLDTMSCFTKKIEGDFAKGAGNAIVELQNEPQEVDFAILTKLEQIINARFTERPDGAYTTYLFNEGVDKILKKVGEEAAEVIIAAKNRSQAELKWEAADLIYHLLVLLREQEVNLAHILQVLEERHLEN